MTRGAYKYWERNRELWQETDRFLASAMRHMFQYAEWDITEDHLSAILFNVMWIIHMQEEWRTDILKNKADRLFIKKTKEVKEEYTIPTTTTYQSYKKIKNDTKNKTYPKFFEYLVWLTGLEFDYPYNWNNIQDGIINGSELLNKINTDKNKKVLEKILEIVWFDCYITIWIDKDSYIIYAGVRSGYVRFIRSGFGGDLCLVPSKG